MPQIFQTTEIARPAYYDRDAVSVFTGYANIVAPHANTLRASYSPPFGFANFGEFIELSAIRITASGGPLLATGILNIAPFYGGEFSVAQCVLLNGTAGASDKVILTGLGYIAFGDTLKLYSSDASAGGTVQYNLYFKGCEFFF